MLSNKNYVLPAITFFLGVMLGQVSIITAFNPIRFVYDSAELAARSYNLGCVQAKGLNCTANTEMHYIELMKGLKK